MAADDPFLPTTGETERPKVSTRDREDVRRRLVAWLARHVTDPEIAELRIPETNGMSSETLMFDVVHTDSAGDRATIACAARLAPDADAMPVFPVYDLAKQFHLMRLVAERSSVPVPATLWFEPDTSLLGSPFLVMERVDGVVPSDIPPYTFGGWFMEGTDDDRRRLQEHSVGVLAAVHGADVTPDETAFLELDRPGATPLRRHFADQEALYEWVVADGMRSPLLERTFEWLDARWPDETEPVVCWGDSRIGNILYRDFEPAAVLDWEMAALAPREMDVGWMVFFHRFFQDITEILELEGAPHFMRMADVASRYEQLTGHTPRDLEWYAVYAALRHGIIMFRIGRRFVHFGEAEMPDDPDMLVTHRAMLESMLAGEYRNL